MTYVTVALTCIDTDKSMSFTVLWHCERVL